MFCEVVVGNSLLTRSNNPSVAEYTLSNAPVRAYAVRETRVRLHHRAYDSYLIGITSEFKIVVGRRIKEQSDIPILSTLKKLDGGSLMLPKELQLQPNKDRLAERFNEFLLQN